jgi:GalNAc-alpha-(1->4)-GalNAc-alpha-(1->3)-diNAcBac-PP-undecaprenol alpha-1,4-N-acetyl-D-galactosaminyltransferase
MVKKKIAFVIPYLDSGGAERVVTTLANELVNYYEVSIITYTKKDPFYELDSRIQLYYCLETLAPSRNTFAALFNNYKLIRRLWQLFREKQIAVVIGFLTSANVLTIIAGKLCGVKVIISERNNPKRDRIQKMWEFLRRKTYPYADTLVVQTEYIKSVFQTYVDENKIVILPNPINPDLSKKRIFNRERNNEILSVGRLTDQKNHEMLIRAFALAKIDNWILIIAGEGENRVRLEKIVEELNLKNRVLLLGRQKNIAEFYNSASIFAFSSNYEGFPNALIEAMHFGMACISTDCPTGPSELIENGTNGFLTSMHDVEKMAEGLKTLTENKELRSLFGKKAKERVKVFEVAEVLSQWNRVLEG